ncbi:MAG: right-handed parallel beta-helix repeat-containing protein, partial [Ginsengibacter sp.]
MNRVLSNSVLPLLLSLFLLFSKSSHAQSSCGCDHTLKPAADGGIYFTNGNGMTILPGEKVCIQAGYYPYISLTGLVGTAAKPITITNCGGQVVCGSGPTYCYRIINSRYFKFTGTGTPGITYGFKAYWSGGTTAAGMSVRDSTSDYEIDHLETQNSQNGFLCKIDPEDCSPGTWSTGWTIKNISIHDNYVHNTVGEGMYLINTGVTQDVQDCNNGTITIEAVKADGVKVYNNIVDSSGWDGIQVAASANAEIYNNKVTNYGMQNLGSQQAGIILGGKSNGAVHDNYINGGTGEGLEIFGSGLVSIYNNIIANAGWDKSSAGQDAIAVDDRPQPNNKYAGLKVYILNNTIVNAARNAIHLFNSYNTMAQGNKIYNNLLVKPNNKSVYDNPFTNIDGNTNVDTLNNVKIPVIANANFVNATANDFHLQANSPAIDKGLNTVSYGVTKDYDGVSRPQGSAFDAGAFEYNFGTPPQNVP